MGRLKVGVRSFLLLFGDFSEIGYLTNFHINLFSDLINIRSCFCLCVYLCRFTSGVKSILKLCLGKSIVTDGKTGVRRGREVQRTRGPSCFEEFITGFEGLVTGFEGPRFYKTFSLERDTRQEMLEKLRLLYETFFLETNEKIRIKFWYRGKRWKPVGSTGTGRVEILRLAGHPGQKTGQIPFSCS